jgi:Immunoglobulin domain
MTSSSFEQFYTENIIRTSVSCRLWLVILLYLKRSLSKRTTKLLNAESNIIVSLSIHSTSPSDLIFNYFSLPAPPSIQNQGTYSIRISFHFPILIHCSAFLFPKNTLVAWIKSDSKAILAIHTHMVALNPRLSVTHNGHNTWKLHISHVQLNDSGSYMCQVNTDPMRSQVS